MDADRAVRDHLIGAIRMLPHGATVAAHCPMHGEPGGPDLVGALARALPPAGRLLLPVLRLDLDLDWATYTGELVPGPRGLHQPPGPLLGPEAITRAVMVIVPAVAVDRAGIRLGRGGGSYDRSLARLTGTVPVLALTYPGETPPALPAAPHDRRVSAVVTPDGITTLPDTSGDAPAPGGPEWTTRGQ